MDIVTLSVLASALVLPVGKVEQVRDARSRVCPARVVSISEVDVRPQVTGEILSVGFVNGQKVEKGDVLYELDPVKYIAAEKNAEAKVAQVKASLEYAETQTERYGKLVKARAVPQDDYDRARAQRNAHQASLAAAEADLVSARDDLKHCKITAPISGRVGSTAFTEGNFVSRGGAPLVKLVQTDPVRVAFELSSVAGGAVIATGVVEYVENVANAATDSVKVYARVANADGALLDGQTVMATLSNAKGALRVAVPPNAVALDSRGAYVWVVGEDGKASQRRVVRGRLQADRQLLSSGLRDGERIVLDGVHRVKEGDEIEAEK